MTKLLTAEQVAEMLGCSLGHIYNMTSQRRITAIKGLCGVRYEEREIERLIAQHRVEARPRRHRAA